MYKFDHEKQISFTDFNQPQGMQMNPNNRWVKKAAMIPWETIETEYAKLFPSHTGMPAKPLRMALGSLLIQKQYRFPDEELVEQIRENPYYQYFIGLPGYEDKIPFVPSLLVEFRKRLSEDVLNEINEMIIAYNTQQDDDDSDDGNGDASQSDQENSAMDSENAGTLILDATCASQKAEKKIAYQDNTDRIEVERKFSLAKRKFGLNLLLTKREDTTRASIVLSIIAMNIDRLVAMLLRLIQFWLNFGLSYGPLERS